MAMLLEKGTSCLVRKQSIGYIQWKIGEIEAEQYL